MNPAGAVRARGSDDGTAQSCRSLMYRPPLNSCDAQVRDARLAGACATARACCRSGRGLELHSAVFSDQ